MKQNITFKGNRIDNGEEVIGYYFKTPLTDENSGADSSDGLFFLTGDERHCISVDGIAYVVDHESIRVIHNP